MGGGVAPGALRALPAVDRLADGLDGPRALAVRAAREVLGRRREDLRGGSAPDVDLHGLAQARLDALVRPSLRRVVNATGVIVHTNLGRAPLARAAREAVARAAEGYSNLEWEASSSGGRGSRVSHVSGLLAELCGAEDGLAVNNAAGAVLLGVAALAGGGGAEVVVSRGQLVEIGGGFRVPDVVAQSGARLVEVGTTNRTRVEDYARALGPQTGAILRAHPSNFRQLGFVEEVDVEALCALGPPVIDDVGSGNLAELDVLAGEPPVRRSVAAGTALVCFSGDKLLGGPQAGLLVGRRDAVRAAAAHPLARALRIDKLSLAALEATLRLYREPERARAEIPVLEMLTVSEEKLARRAEALATSLDGELVRASAKVGGGALPLLELEGPAVALPARRADELRGWDPPVVGRVHEGRLLLDPRTLSDEEVSWIAQRSR